jgi:hypothetical protein
MSKAIFINGGLGRCVASLPAIHEVTRQDPSTIIITGGWPEFWASTGLNCIEMDSLAVEPLISGKDVISPEPYYMNSYREGKIDMVEAFNELLNVEGDNYRMYPNTRAMKELMGSISEQNPDGLPVICIQPKASGTANIRDLNQDNTLNIIRLVQKAGGFPVIIGDTDLYFDPKCTTVNETNLTQYISLIGLCHAFIGGDSSGMHIAKALNKPGVILLTSTAGIKYYPDHFTELRVPNHEDSKEFPRLFSVETKRMNHNEAGNLGDYVFDEDKLSEAITKLMC